MIQNETIFQLEKSVFWGNVRARPDVKNLVLEVESSNEASA